MVVLYIDNQKIPLFNDENIFYENKLTSPEEIGSIFNDATNSFTIPSTPVTDELFKNIYEIGRFDSFNSQKRVNAYIEFNTIPFRFGEVQLEGFQRKNGLIDNYMITFYGNLTQLDDLYGDETLQDLFEGYRRWDIRWRTNDITDLFIAPDFAKNPDLQSLQGEVINPLLIVKEDGLETDITTVNGAIKPNEFRPALRSRQIINRIQEKYDIQFTGEFFDKPQFQNLYSWLNGQENLRTENEVLSPIGNLTESSQTTFSNSVQITGINFENIRITRRKAFIDANKDNDTGLHSFFTNLWFSNINVSNQNIPYRFIIRDLSNGEVVVETDEFIGNQSTSAIIPFLLTRKNRLSTRSRFRPGTIEFDESNTYRIEVISNSELTLNYLIIVETGIQRPITIQNAISYRGTIVGSFQTDPRLSISRNIPDMKVKDYFVNLLQQFNLIIRPKDNNTFLIENISDYYRSGNIIDITDYVNLEDITAEREELNRKIEFKYNESNQEANKLLGGNIGNFTLFKDVDNKVEDEVEIDFQFPLFVPLLDRINNEAGNTNLNIALYDEIPNDVINFYYNGLSEVDSNGSNLRVELDLYGTTNQLSLITLCDVTDNQLTNQINNSLDFNPNGFSYFHGQFITNNIYNNNWREYIDALYRNENIPLSFDAVLPWEVIEQLDLNSEVIIMNEKYLIEEYKINLTNGETQFKLFPTYINKFEQLDDTVSNTILAYNPGGTYDSITVFTNKEFTVSVDDNSWISLFKTSGKGVTEIPFKVFLNGQSNRTNNLRVNFIGGGEIVIPINQDGITN